MIAGGPGKRVCRSTWPVACLLGLAVASAPSAQPCNSPPVAQNDLAPHFGTAIVVDVLANDSEPDGEALSVTSLSTTCNGSISEDFGLVTMIPASETREACVITYKATDERGASSALATVSVAPAVFLFGDGFESGDTSYWDGGS